jgi:hypothetical protein
VGFEPYRVPRVTISKPREPWTVRYNAFTVKKVTNPVSQSAMLILCFDGVIHGHCVDFLVLDNHTVEYKLLSCASRTSKELLKKSLKLPDRAIALLSSARFR